VTRGLGEQRVTADRRVEALLEEHVERLAQAEEQMLRRGAPVLLVVGFAVAERPIPVAGAEIRVLVDGERALIGGHERQPGRGHQPLLGARHRDVDAPLVHLERHAAERRHRIHHQQGGVPDGRDRAMDRRDVVDHPGRGVDLDDEDGLDLARGIGGQTLRERGGIDGAPRVALQDLDLDAHHPRHVTPPEREQAALEHQHGLAPRQHVGERGLPAPVAVGGVDVGAPRRPEDPRQILEKAVRDRDHVAGVDVDGRSMHRGEHRVGNVRGTRNAEELAPFGDCHGLDSKRIARPRAPKSLCRVPSKRILLAALVPMRRAVRALEPRGRDARPRARLGPGRARGREASRYRHVASRIQGPAAPGTSRRPAR
jgi:hypothetical protein